MLRLFLHAQYNANMAPLINEITKTANATPDIQVVAQPLTAGSVLFVWKKKNDMFVHDRSIDMSKPTLVVGR